MRERRGARAGRRRTAVAVILLGLGALLLTAGAASASSLAGTVATITFWNNDNVVTLNTPTMCPATTPQCVWKLQVNEPDIPAQTVVGIATGASGSILTVDYPTNFCGVIQADVFVGPSPWRLIVGHQQTIQTGTCCPTGTTQSGICCPPGTTAAATAQAVQPTVSTQSARSTPRRGRLGHATSTARRSRAGHRAATTSTTLATTSAAQATTQAVTCDPITGAVQTVPAPAQLPFTGQTTTVPATSASTPTTTLPFTGVDVKPLVIAGTALIFLGLGIMTTHQQRLRGLARVGYSIRTSRGMTYSSRAARWFLGD